MKIKTPFLQKEISCIRTIRKEKKKVNLIFMYKVSENFRMENGKDE